MPILLTKPQQTMLKNCCLRDEKFPTNPLLTKTIKNLQQINPDAFHLTKASLELRIFYDEPASFIPHKSFIRKRKTNL